MRLLSVAFFACASLFAPSLAAPDAAKWFAFYSGSEKEGLTFLDSSKANIVADTSHSKISDVTDDTKDEGLRFQYDPHTRFVTNQAHINKLVGVEEKDSGNFKANIRPDKENYGKLVRAKFYGQGGGKWEVSLCMDYSEDEPKDCIGANGHRERSNEDGPYKWKVLEIEKVSG